MPLDWSGVAPGSLQLAVEELPAKGTPRGVMMLGKSRWESIRTSSRAGVVPDQAGPDKGWGHGW